MSMLLNVACGLSLHEASRGAAKACRPDKRTKRRESSGRGSLRPHTRDLEFFSDTSFKEASSIVPIINLWFACGEAKQWFADMSVLQHDILEDSSARAAGGLK